MMLAGSMDVRVTTGEQDVSDGTRCAFAMGRRCPKLAASDACG